MLLLSKTLKIENGRMCVVGWSTIKLHVYGLNSSLSLVMGCSQN